jgi:endonuclease/exonuclease/phosphatase family metal-dependent hydrolase
VPVMGWLAVRVTGAGRGTRIETIIVLTPFVALASVLALAVAAALRVRAAMLAAAGCCVGFGVVMAPVFVPGPYPSAAPQGPELRAMTFNALYGDADAAAVVAMVRGRDIDVLGVQELTPAFHERLLDQGLDELLPHSVLDARDGAAGTGLYSRHRVDRVANDVEGRHENPTGLVAVDGAPPVEITVVHPAPPVGAAGRADWRRTFETLPRPARDGAVRVLIGDFNATVDQPTMRDLLADGYVDAAGAVGDGWVITWQSGLAPPLAIDHVLVDRSTAVDDVSVAAIPGSDHRAVVADLRLPAD